MTLEEAKDHREQFVDDLLKLAARISEDPRQVGALMIHLHYEDGALIRAFRIRSGFNLLSIIGAFECAKNEIVQQVTISKG